MAAVNSICNHKHQAIFIYQGNCIHRKWLAWLGLRESILQIISNKDTIQAVSNKDTSETITRTVTVIFILIALFRMHCFAYLSAFLKFISVFFFALEVKHYYPNILRKIN